MNLFHMLVLILPDFLKVCQTVIKTAKQSNKDAEKRSVCGGRNDPERCKAFSPDFDYFLSFTFPHYCAVSLSQRIVTFSVMNNDHGSMSE